MVAYLLIKIGVEWGSAVEGCFLKKKVDWKIRSVGEGDACLFEISLRSSGWVFVVRILCQNCICGGRLVRYTSVKSAKIFALQSYGSQTGRKMLGRGLYI